MAMTTAQRPKGARSEQADDLTWLVAPDASLPDGRAVDAALLSAMIAEWRAIIGGTLSATALLDDAAAVLLAVLDRHLTGAGDLTAWYLATPCDSRNCLYHGDGRGRERKGSGVEPVDYGTLPPLYWNPGYGSVETHPALWHELVARDPSVRRSIRLPIPATVPPGVFQHPRQQ